MPRKENSKAKTWERDRRKRMNGYFKNLADLLPPLLEGRKRNKIDILIHASKYIKDLQSRTDELFNAQASDVHKEELARLKRLVTQLLSRTQLLTDLLKNAGITVPAEPALEKISPLKWSNKINVVPNSKIINNIETGKKGEKKKEKNANSLKIGLKQKSLKTKKNDKPTNNQSSAESSTNENQENHVGTSSDENNKKDENSVASNETVITTVDESSSKTGIENQKKVKLKTKSNKKQMVRKSIADVKKISTSTLVLSNGKIMPVVTPMQSLTPNIIVNTQSHPSNPIILNGTQQGQMIVVQPFQTNNFQTISSVQTMTLSTVPSVQANVLINPQDWAKNVKTIINSSKIGGTKGILPKVKEVTETTMTYKVPIPAIHKEKSDKKNEIKVISTSEKPAKIKTNLKTLKNNESSSTKSENDLKNTKENIKNSDIVNKSMNNQSLKRTSSSSGNTTSKNKKKKRKLSKEENTNVEIKNVVLNDGVTCKSIENLKQVIEKIGDDSSYTKLQINNPLTNDEEPTTKKQKNENDSLNETNSTISKIDNNEKEESTLLTKLSVVEKALNADGTEASEIFSEKEIDSAITKKHLEVNLPEVTNEIMESNKEKESSLLTEVAMEVHHNQPNSTIEKTDSELSTTGASITENIQMLSNQTNQNCNIEPRIETVLGSNNQSEIINESIPSENNKIFLNLDTNTTTTMKLENSENKVDSISHELQPHSPSMKVSNEEDTVQLKNQSKGDHNILKTIPYSPSNSFVPINHKSDSLHSDLSNDIFASLQVPSSSNNSESISPTAAFLMAFPIVSSITGKTEVLDDEMKDDFKYSSQTPPMLLQIGTIEPNNFKINSRTSLNEPTTDISSVNEQPAKAKTSTEPIIPVSGSLSVTTPQKTLPRVISSQTLTESFKIVPASSEQINRQIRVETNNSIQNQVSSAGNATGHASINTTVNRDQSSAIANTIQNRNDNKLANFQSENKSETNYNFTKDVSLPSMTNNSMTNEIILNKYIPVTSISTNTITTESMSKYNSVSHYIQQDCQSALPNCSKDNVDRNNSQYNFACQTTNDIPTDKDLCKLSICSMEDFTERSNEYSTHNKQTSFSSVSVQTSSSESSNKNIQASASQNKNSGIQSTQALNESINASDNFHPSGKKIESKDNCNAERNIIYSKKTNDMTNSNSYLDLCDSVANSKVHKKQATVSQSNSSVQKIVTSTSSSNNNTFSQPTETYIATTNYEDINKSTTTVANNSSNFSILSWTMLSSPLNTNNGTSFPQFDQVSAGATLPTATSDVTKATCDNFNYLPLPKDNVSLANDLMQTSYSIVDSQAPVFDKSKAKMSLDMQKKSYSDLNKTRNMRLSQAPSMQKQTRAHHQTGTSSSDYKFSTENKNKYKYSMDVDYTQHNYSTGLDMLHQHNPHQNQQSHESSNAKISSSQSHSSMKSSLKSSTSYMLTDYNSHMNFMLDSSSIPTKYPNNHTSYTGTTFKYGEKNSQTHSKYQSSSQLSTPMLHHSQENSLYNSKPVPQQHNSHQSQIKAKVDLTNQVQTSTQQQQQQQPHQQQQQQPQQQPQQQQPIQQLQTHQQHTVRPPVNWMMTPDIKHNTNIDIILPPIGKELDFCQNNLFSQPPSYNQTSSNHQFYSNYDMTTHALPNIAVLPPEPKRNADATYYPEEQQFSWSPTKSLSQITEQNSLKNSNETMPALVADLALPASVPDKQNFLYSQIPLRANEASKDTQKNKDSSRDYQTLVNPQNSSHGMAFLSVSQLVEKNQQQIHDHQQPHHHHQLHHQQQQQPQQQQQQQSSRKQRKSNSNTSPRASNKRQMDMRQKHQQQPSSNEQVHRQHEEVKSSSTFSDASNYQPQQQQQQPQQQQQQQQQQKYNQQNEVQWRSRNCKSNYTAEALIGTTDNNHMEKNVPKFSNYQNKFPSNLTPDSMSFNYFPNVDEASAAGYGQVINQNFNHSYTYTSNANIYPTSNFMSNTSGNYMMSLHDNVTADYLESNNFLLPTNVSTTTTTTTSTSTTLLSHPTDVKSQQPQAQQHQQHQHQQQQHHPHNQHSQHNQHQQSYSSSKHQICSDKRTYFSQSRKSKKKLEFTSGSSGPPQSLEFPGISSPLEDYQHAPGFLAPPNSLYPNQPNVYGKSSLPPPPLHPAPPTVSAPPPPVVSSSTSSLSNNSMLMTQHHPSGTSLTNFNLSTIFPEINDKVQATGYKSSSNGVVSVATQPTSHSTSTSYAQRSNYTDPLGQMSQVNRH